MVVKVGGLGSKGVQGAVRPLNRCRAMDVPSQKRSCRLYVVHSLNRSGYTERTGANRSVNAYRPKNRRSYRPRRRFFQQMLDRTIPRKCAVSVWANIFGRSIGGHALPQLPTLERNGVVTHLARITLTRFNQVVGCKTRGTGFSSVRTHLKIASVLKSRLKKLFVVSRLRISNHLVLPVNTAN